MFNLFVDCHMAMPIHAVDLEGRYFDHRKKIFFDLQCWFLFFHLFFWSIPAVGILLDRGLKFGASPSVHLEAHRYERFSLTSSHMWWTNFPTATWSRSQSYKTSSGEKRYFFGIIYATFQRTNLSVEINANITPKNVFCRNSDSTKQLYRIENVVFLNYANAKILVLALWVLKDRVQKFFEAGCRRTKAS